MPQPDTKPKERVIKAGLTAWVNPKSKRQTKSMPMDNFYPIIVTEKKRTYTHVKSGKVYTMPVGKSQRAQSIGKRFRVHSGCEGNSPKRDLNGTYVSEDELIILKEHRKKPKKSTTKSSE